MRSASQSACFSSRLSTISAVANPNVIYNNPGVYDVTLIATYSDKTDTLVLQNYISVDSCPVILNVKVFIEGFYIGNNLMNATLSNIFSGDNTITCDSLTVELHNENPPYNLEYISVGTISKFGFGSFIFPTSVLNERYYIVIKHRSAIDTWSKNPILFNEKNVNIDFTH